MLVSMKETMKIAREQNYCIPAPSAANEHALRAYIEAAEEKKSPLIILCMFKHNPDICYYGRIATDLAVRSNVPISICLDHSSTFEHAIWGIRAGFSDIMIDRSTLPYEENIAQVKELVRIAHSVGVGVEAELGHVGSGENYSIDGTACYTNPDEAVKYVRETEIDALAVAIGTAHGIYKGTPHLQFDLLKNLHENVSVPLVLHGGSGTGDENLRKAASMGINKLNLANDMLRAAVDSLNSADLSGNGVYSMYPLMAKGMKDKLLHYIDICGSAGKASVFSSKRMGNSTDTEGINEAV